MASQIIIPIITIAGRAAAIRASNDGIELAVTHVSFGAAAYSPVGDETSLRDEKKRVPVMAGGKITPTQIRLAGIWPKDGVAQEINEIGYWAGSTLIAVYSRERPSGVGPIAYKPAASDFVMFNDLKFIDIPSGSLTVQVTSDGSALAALMSHELAGDPHPQYVLEARMPDAEAFLFFTASGTANAIVLTPPDGVSVPMYKAGQRFVFMAAYSNTAAVTVAVAGLNTKALTKNGSDALKLRDIKAGAICAITYDGIRFQLGSGAGSGGATGGGADQVFYLNDQTINNDYTIPAGQNAHSAGPITIADGKSVTISDGSVWTIS